MERRLDAPSGNPDSVREAFDPEAFRRDGRRLVDLLADHLARAAAREGPVLPAGRPAEVLARWPGAFPAEAGDVDPKALFAAVLEGSNHLHHPRFVGHQVTSPLPLAALADLAAALLINGMAVFEMGPVATAMERRVLRFLADAFGYGAGADGVLTSGGSIGNLTALLAARQAKAGFDAWRGGAGAGPPLAILASAQTHYCVRRAAAILGLGEAGMVEVAVDERFRMRPDDLAPAMTRAWAAGRRVVAVVASAGSTATGAFDPLPEIADFCAARGLWLHVDGAHGAAAALSPRTREKVAGLARADSVVVDAHKMMLMPALVTAVIYRDGRRAWDAFAQEASYLFHEREDAWADVATRTLECTKKMLSLKLYAALSIYGTRLFGDYVAESFARASRFAARIREAPDFELLLEPECNIVCFRLAPPGVQDLDALQARVRERVVASGAFYLVQTRVRDALWLRTTIINPATTDDDLCALLEALRAASRGEPPSSTETTSAR
jgi:L-2,4-diaminobutyrate decarboxylase